jgi:hypothetical protein
VWCVGDLRFSRLDELCIERVLNYLLICVSKVFVVVVVMGHADKRVVGVV